MEPEAPPAPVLGAPTGMTAEGEATTGVTAVEAPSGVTAFDGAESAENSPASSNATTVKV